MVALSNITTELHHSFWIQDDFNFPDGEESANDMQLTAPSFKVKVNCHRHTPVTSVFVSDQTFQWVLCICQQENRRPLYLSVSKPSSGFFLFVSITNLDSSVSVHIIVVVLNQS
jgi:hypothetical protein